VLIESMFDELQMGGHRADLDWARQLCQATLNHQHVILVFQEVFHACRVEFDINGPNQTSIVNRQIKSMNTEQSVKL